jgi:hypothetical protein
MGFCLIDEREACLKLRDRDGCCLNGEVQSVVAALVAHGG